ncbi:hypothetical protein FE633_08875 [Streptomyces montanus]|uniref:Uncharacterized protein n=1 Tax=Streptomyces montanus TaxID=2580423 RepID=A0A5R9G4E4_9ACTN|nr:hypothetical protein [Streptomyces montanus]TLS46425.1 hypothetical protein FE633_08875 [Streptomyces montanus]
MRVVFLALDATRRQAVTSESAEVVAGGGRAVVLVENRKAWEEEPFAPGVEVVELRQLELRHPPRLLEWLLLFRGPRVVAALLGRGPLRPFVRRAERAYERRVALPLHRRVFTPAYRKVYGDVRQQVIGSLVRRRSPEVIVLADSAGLRYAPTLLDGASVPAPRMAYSLRHS